MDLAKLFNLFAPKKDVSKPTVQQDVVKRTETSFDNLGKDNVRRIDLKLGGGTINVFVVVPKDNPINFGPAEEWAKFIEKSIHFNFETMLKASEIEQRKANEGFDAMLHEHYKTIIPVH